MTTWKDLFDRIDETQKNFSVMVEDSLQQTSEQFRLLNTGQMVQGETNEGKPIKPDYAPSTQKRKGRKTPNLFETGDFFEGYHATVVDNNMIKMDSDVEYTKYIDAKYSKIWGLTGTNTEKYAFGPFWSVLQKKLEESTQLNFV